MKIKDIVTILLSGLLGGLSAVTSAWITGNHLLESNQVQITASLKKYENERKDKFFDRIINTYLSYSNSVDEFVSLILFEEENENKLRLSIINSQRLGQELIVLTNDEISYLVNDLNKKTAALLKIASQSGSEVDLSLQQLIESKSKLQKEFRELLQNSMLM